MVTASLPQSDRFTTAVIWFNKVVIDLAEGERTVQKLKLSEIIVVKVNANKNMDRILCLRKAVAVGTKALCVMGLSEHRSVIMVPRGHWQAGESMVVPKGTVGASFETPVNAEQTAGESVGES